MAYLGAGTVFELDEHDLDPVLSPVSPLAAADGLATRLPARDAKAYPLCLAEHLGRKSVSRLQPVISHSAAGTLLT